MQAADAHCQARDDEGERIDAFQRTELVAVNIPDSCGNASENKGDNHGDQQRRPVSGTR